jgi:tRNA threonylcarbamoyladenosine biosynthesis protein TsaB
MKILLIDTCGATGSVALAEGGAAPVVTARASLPGRTASERLLPAIRALIAGREVALAALDAIAVVHGPGSFTGVRVGLSAAKGLCEAAGVPLVAISRLAVLADKATQPDAPRANALPHAPTHAPVHALLDAGRGEFYYGKYVRGSCARESLLTREQAIAAVNLGAAGAVVVICEAAVAHALAGLSPQLVDGPTAEDALPLAMQRVREGAFDDIAAIDANYLRRTDAEIFAKPKAAPPRDAPGAPPQ